MSNTPNFRRGASLKEFVDKRFAGGSIDVPIGDDDHITIPPRDMWPREAKVLLERQAADLRARLPEGERVSDKAIVTAIIGAEAFGKFADEFAKVGGDRADAGSFFFRYHAAEIERQQGVDAGE